MTVFGLGRVAIPGLFALIAVFACNAPPLFPEPPADANSRFEGLEPESYTLFGRPNEDGVSSECCMPSCPFEEDGEAHVWTAPVYTPQDMETLYWDWELVTPWPVFAGNEFRPPLDPPDPRVPWVCAVVPRPELRNDSEAPMPYDLVDYPSREAAEAAGAMVTHRGRCGACSSLRNLAIYIAYPDLTEPIRECALVGIFDSSFSRLACIASLGFDLPCAQAWDFNTTNTQKKCISVCGGPKKRKKPANIDYECGPGKFVPTDINLVSDCLACDELFSLEIFRTAAGRSRRGSGLPSPICRRCEGVERIEHFYRMPEP
ncbi:MAG: hypothetical protein AAGF92_14170 [Myxococcota bacterium]